MYIIIQISVVYVDVSVCAYNAVAMHAGVAKEDGTRVETGKQRNHIFTKKVCTMMPCHVFL